MLESALLAFGVSTLGFGLLYILTYYEYVSGRRLGRRVRVALDILVTIVVSWWDNVTTHLIRYVLQLGWYYSLHSILRTILLGLVEGYHALEAVFERNRARTKELRRELKQRKQRNHLDEIHEHKANTALTETEKRRRRKRGM